MDLVEMSGGQRAGVEFGVKYRLHNGLLDLEVQRNQADDVIEFFKERMKTLSRIEKSDQAQFIWIHRMSRMCWELMTESRLSLVDHLDAALLYEVPQDVKFEWIFRILNPIRASLRTVSCTIVVADHVAKSIDDIMTS
jgi:hypothetical protein